MRNKKGSRRFIFRILLPKLFIYCHCLSDSFGEGTEIHRIIQWIAVPSVAFLITKVQYPAKEKAPDTFAGQVYLGLYEKE